MKISTADITNAANSAVTLINLGFATWGALSAVFAQHGLTAEEIHAINLAVEDEAQRRAEQARIDAGG